MKTVSEWVMEIPYFPDAHGINKGHMEDAVKAIRQEAVEECVKAISCINVTYQGVWIGYKTAVDAIRKVGEEPYLKKCTEMTEEEWADRNERP